MIITDERKELFKALSIAQGRFTTVAKDKDNPFFKSLYAPLDSIIEMIRPILAENGLTAMQFTDLPDTGEGVLIETIITHESGQYISGKLYMPAAKLDPQGFGSAITYGRRYALAAALGIVSDEDTDANDIKGKPKNAQEGTKSPPQATAIPEGDKDHMQRVKTALRAIYGNDIQAGLSKVEELTTFKNKEGKEIKGTRDLAKITGKRLEILCHNLEKLVPKPPKDAPPPLADSCPLCLGDHLPSQPCREREPGEDDI